MSIQMAIMSLIILMITLNMVKQTIVKIVFVLVMVVWMKRMVLVLVIVVVLIHRSAFTMHCQIDAKAPGWIGDGGFDTLPSIQTSALT